MDSQNKVTKSPSSVEQLLQLKRAEQPSPAFWEDFDRELHDKLLASAVKPRPFGESWRARVRLLGAGSAALATWGVVVAMLVGAHLEPSLPTDRGLSAASEPLPDSVSVAHAEERNVSAETELQARDDSFSMETLNASFAFAGENVRRIASTHYLPPVFDANVRFANTSMTAGREERSAPQRSSY